jgi:DNA-binding SARP family transcriptional activator/DNA-binding beta-propeller fold protein YncE
MQFRILGPLEVREGRGRRIELGAAKRRSLLGVLLLHPNEAVSSDRLIEELWGTQPPALAPKLVQGHVSALRKLLGADRILTRPPGYLIDVDDDELDLLAFSRLVQDARGQEPARTAALLGEALALWRGPALADVELEGFAARELEQLDELRLAAQVDRIEADLALGRDAELVAQLDPLVSRHPYNERLRGQLMLALYRSGRQADALGVYRQGRRVLVDELGLEPSDDLKELERAILAHEVAPARIARSSRVAVAVPPPSQNGDGPARLADASDDAPPAPFWRTATALAAALALAAAVAGVLVFRAGDPAVTRLEPNSVGLIDPVQNALVAQTRVGIRPTKVAATGRAVWVVNDDDRTLSEVDPDGPTVRGTTPVARTMSSLATAGARVWLVVSEQGSSTLERIDPTFDVVAAKRRLGRVARFVGLAPVVGAVAVGDGSLWAGSSYGDVIRVDPVSLRPKAKVTTEGGTRGLAVTADAVWAIAGDGVVVRIDPMTAQIVERFTVAADAVAVAADANAAWVASTSENVVTRIDKTSGSVTTVAVGRQPRDVALGFGSVWVANAGDGTVSRIDPRSREVVATIELGVSVEGIATGAGGVWVTGFAPLHPRGE